MERSASGENSVLLALLAVAVVLALPLAAMACPNCKLSVEHTDGAVQGVSTGPAGSMAAGYAYSIYLMLGVPALLAASLVMFIRRQVLNMAKDTPSGPQV